MQRQSLGRGLNALLAENVHTLITGEDTQNHLKTYQLKPSRFQPRTTFDDEALQSLVDSIREKGVLQPLLVRKLKLEDEKYEIIAGERRWRAAKILNLETLPVIIKNCNDQEALEIAIIENVQRSDLNSMEEALGYKRLLDEFQYTQDQLSRVIGKSRSHIANTLRLLNLPDSIQDLLTKGKITAGHARALLGHENPEAFVEKILAEGLNVRAVEAGVKKKRPGSFLMETDEIIMQARELGQTLMELTGHPTDVAFSKNGARVTLHFDTIEALDSFIDRLRTLET